MIRRKRKSLAQRLKERMATRRGTMTTATTTTRMTMKKDEKRRLLRLLNPIPQPTGPHPCCSLSSSLSVAH